MTKPQKSFSIVFFSRFHCQFLFSLKQFFYFILFFHINIIQVLIFHQPGTPLLSKNNHSMDQKLLQLWTGCFQIYEKYGCCQFFVHFMYCGAQPIKKSIPHVNFSKRDYTLDLQLTPQVL